VSLRRFQGVIELGDFLFLEELEMGRIQIT
jgi:hypothetical protein